MNPTYFLAGVVFSLIGIFIGFTLCSWLEALRNKARAKALPELYICEEVPGVEPRWFIRGCSKHFGDSPKFDRLDNAEAFCKSLNRPYKIVFFDDPLFH